MANAQNIAFTASPTRIAQDALKELTTVYGSVPLERADVIVALGGDGFMLQTLHGTMHLDVPVYGMNCGTIGFLMNENAVNGLIERLTDAEETAINPLAMSAEAADGTITEGLAINEVSLLRAGPQAARLKVSIDGKVRLDELVCDGALLSTPAGSTAYNYSAHGPILPIGSDVLALTAMAAFRPRRWRGALLPKSANLWRFDPQTRLPVPRRRLVRQYLPLSIQNLAIDPVVPGLQRTRRIPARSLKLGYSVRAVRPWKGSVICEER